MEAISWRRNARFWKNMFWKPKNENFELEIAVLFFYFSHWMCGSVEAPLVSFLGNPLGILGESMVVFWFWGLRVYLPATLGVFTRATLYIIYLYYKNTPPPVAIRNAPRRNTTPFSPFLKLRNETPPRREADFLLQAPERHPGAPRWLFGLPAACVV